MEIRGLSLAAWSRDGNLWSVFGCLDQGRKSVINLRLHGARKAVRGLSSAAWSIDDNLQFVPGCLEQKWQSVVCLLVWEGEKLDRLPGDRRSM